MPRLTVGLAIRAGLFALATACAESPVGLSTSERVPALLASENASVPDISGAWSYHELATLVIWDFDPQGKKTFQCTTDGTNTFAQIGAKFTGKYVQTGTCIASDGTTIDNSFLGDIARGTIQGRQLRFHPDNVCNFAGTLSRSLTRMEGTGVCGVPEIAVYRARWSATR